MGGAVALRTEALREALPDFYARAVVDAEIDPITPPEIDITAGQESGALAFDALVEVRPLISVPGYAGLLVTVPSPQVTDAEVDAQLDRMRDQDGELVAVTRPAIDKDHVTIDLRGTGPGGEEALNVEDFLYEVGSATVVDQLDIELRGSKPGDMLMFTAPAPGGPELSFRLLVKEVQEKRLPAVTDEWAAESSEFATVEALRTDLSSRIGRVKKLADPDGLAQQRCGRPGRAGRRRRRPRGPGGRRGPAAPPRPGPPARAAANRSPAVPRGHRSHRRPAGRGAPGGRPAGGEGRPGPAGGGRGGRSST